jgi:hypothetical protein
MRLGVERLRKLELYGLQPSHPSEAPRREQARVLVFHMADVESCDASCVYRFCAVFSCLSAFAQRRADFLRTTGDLQGLYLTTTWCEAR